MSDALPLPSRPDLEQYKKLAKDLQRAFRSTDPDAFHRCALRWLATLARAKQRAIRELNYDSATKVLAVTRRRFWEQARRAGTALVCRRDGCLPGGGLRLLHRGGSHRRRAQLEQ